MTTARPPVLAVRPDQRPSIVCPPWCVDSYDHHLEELGEWEGFVIHHSAGGQVWHSRHAYPDNTLTPEEPPLIWIADNKGLTIDQARDLVSALLAAIAEADQ